MYKKAIICSIKAILLISQVLLWMNRQLMTIMVRMNVKKKKLLLKMKLLLIPIHTPRREVSELVYDFLP